MQGKGGVGKTTSAAYFVQSLKAAGFPAIVLDTDPVNQTLAAYKSLEAVIVDIMDGEEIDGSKFDAVVEVAVGVPDGSHLVVDTGSSNFVKLMSYLKSTNALGIIKDSGQEVRIHAVIVGGTEAKETFSRVRDFAVSFSAIDLIIWKNQYFGPVHLLNTSFEETNLYHEFKNKFSAIVEIPSHLPADTFGRDIQQMLIDRLSFEEGIKGGHYHIMHRQRLQIYWDKLQAALKKAHLI